MRFIHPSLLCCLLLGLASGASAATIWDEAGDGDLSTAPATPTSIVLGQGSNLVIGSVTLAGDTRDYLTFTVGAGQALASLMLLDWQNVNTGGPGNTGYNSINIGNTSQIPGAGNTGFFLGGSHVIAGLVGTDLFAGLSNGGIIAGVGFPVPLGPGTYSYVIQQTSPLQTGYTLDFVLIPEPTTAALLGLGLACMAGSSRRNQPPS